MGECPRSTDGPGRQFLLPFVCFLTVAPALAPAQSGQQPPGGPDRQPPQLPPAPVEVATVAASSVREEQAFAGTVQPRRRVRFGSGAAGRVVAAPARRGDRVAAGQELVRLRELPTALRLAAARSELALRTAEAQEAHNGPRPEEIAIAKARLAAAEAQIGYDEWALQRALELHRAETMSEDALRRAQLQRDASRATREEAAAQLALLRAGTRTERIAQAKARVAMQVEVVKQLEDQVDKLRIRSPFPAFVSAELTEVGAWLEIGAPVIELIDLDEVEIEVPVPEGSTEHVQIGSSVTVELPNLPGTRFPGTVIAIPPDADPRSRTLPVRIRVPNEIEDRQPLIKAGMLASVRLPVGAPREGLLVPKDALVLGGASPAVYMLAAAPDADGLATVRLVPVTLAFAIGTRQVVSGPGLAAGAKVVVRGNERLRPGQIVRVQDASPGGGAARKGK